MLSDFIPSVLREGAVLTEEVHEPVLCLLVILNGIQGVA